MEVVQIGNISFHTYGFILGLAIVVGVWVAELVVKRYYKVPYMGMNDVEKSVVWIVGFGVLGARAYHVIDYWNHYSVNPAEILMVWRGGLGIYGAIIGGLLGILIYVKFSLGAKLSWNRYVEKFYGLMDVVFVGLPLSQAIGRLGNYVNQELYGKPTDLPWGIYIDIKNRLLGYEEHDFFHPLFLYESIWNLIGFAGLLFLMRKNILMKGKGNYSLLYLLWYGFGRSLLEPMRIRYWAVLGVPVASMIGVSIMMLVAMIIYIRKRKGEWKVLVN